MLVLLADEIAARLDHFAETVTQVRRAQRLPLLDPTIYEALPCSASLQDNSEWRCSELTVANTLINRHFENRRPLQTLDVGAYNGWLSHQPARDGHAVTAIEYFRGAFDGLGARKHYSSQWQAIQMDLVDLAPLCAHFDVVIMNHGLHFFPDPIAHAKQHKETV